MVNNLYKFKYNYRNFLCLICLTFTLYEPHHEKTCLCHMQTTKVQISLRSLISTFVVHCLDSIILLVSLSKISSLYLASVAEQAGLSLKTGFLMTWLIYDHTHIQAGPCEKGI